MATLHYMTTTHFDHGALERLGRELQRLGISRPLICTDRGLVAAGLVETVQAQLPEGMTATVFDGTPANPTESATLAALGLYREMGCDGIVAVGGGSSMDLAKGVALLATHPEPLAQYAAVEKGSRKIGSLAPLIAIPTTAGTGSEVSLGAVIITDDGRKLTFASQNLIPRVAICDPSLTLGLPPGLTAATGMDAMTHCIETFLSPTIDPPADAIALDGLARGIGAGWLERAVADGSDRDARWHMMMASTEGAMAFVKGLGAVHAMSHAAGRIRSLNPHHGTLNAVILPAVLRFNRDHCGDKYARLRNAMNLPPATDIAEAVERLNERLKLPANLRAMGMTDAMLPELIAHSVADLNGFTNPRKASAEDYERLFADAMG
ncbi:MAG: iron-containing alcohol dehydrogenase [Alphaproteobacteria bacterium]